jgi:3-oxoacyl-[acyl-carrier-protein] synthase II
MIRHRRVVITGLGAVTPLGVGVSPFWEGLLTGRSGVGPITLFDASDYPCRIAAEVHEFDAAPFLDRKQARLMSRGAQFGAVAGLQALADANWRPGADAGVGVYAGVSNSAQEVAESTIETMQRHGYRRVLPYAMTKCFPHCAASETARLLGFQDQVITVSTGCTSGLNALRFATAEIAAGHGDALLVIAADASIAKYVFGVFCQSGMLSLRNDHPAAASRPFDAKRDGGVLGEGAGAVLIEELGHARRRDARPYAEILGFGTSGRGYAENADIAIPNGMSHAMRQALNEAGCDPRQLDYIGCHGVSDPRLDRWETLAMKQALGEQAYRVPMSSIKAQIGIPQNAAGMLQLLATLLAMRHDTLPPTGNYEYPDPECDLDYVPNRPRRNRVRRALVLVHGFNGSDAAVAVGSLAPP